jgi:hypothetical protein
MKGSYFELLPNELLQQIDDVVAHHQIQRRFAHGMTGEGARTLHTFPHSPSLSPSHSTLLATDLPHHWVLGSERFRVPEVLFRPDRLPLKMLDGTRAAFPPQRTHSQRALTTHANVASSDVERITLSVQELALMAIKASPVDIQLRVLLMMRRVWIVRADTQMVTLQGRALCQRRLHGRIDCYARVRSASAARARGASALWYLTPPTRGIRHARV